MTELGKPLGAMRLPAATTDHTAARQIAQRKADTAGVALVLFPWRADWIIDRHVPGVTATIPAAEIITPVPDGQ